MSDLKIDNVNSVYIKVNCERGLARELSDYFTFKVPGHQYMPAFKNKVWNGEIKLYNMFTYEIYKGLYRYILKFAEDRNYTVEDNIKEKRRIVPEDKVDIFVNSYLKPHISGEKIEAYPHQMDAITHGINTDRCLLLCPTGSGKSLIIYSLVRYYLDRLPEDKKVLIVVPTTSLVSQMYSDFADYSEKDPEWRVEDECHVVFAGQEKISKSRVVISTWQSIYKQKEDYFNNFGAVFGDECHLFKAKSLTTLMTKLKDCDYRIGTTGTLDGTATHKLVIEGLFGPTYNVTSTKKLMDKNLLSELTIDCILLNYPDSMRQEVKSLKYQEELNWLVTSNERNQFITDLSLKLAGNTLILFQLVEKHGKRLYNAIKKEAGTDRSVFFVHGGTEVELREQIRQITEMENNAIIVASYGTFSTGISIRRLHNIIFASPSKSRVRVLQSIGRQLRKSEYKSVARLYDIGDDLQWKSRKNFSLKHFNERIKIYDTEKFNHRTVNIKIKEPGE